MRIERQQEAAALFSLQACLMNRVSVFCWSRQTVPSARAQPPVKCSVRLLQQEQQGCLNWGVGGHKKTAAFQTVTERGLLTVIDSSDSHW